MAFWEWFRPTQYLNSIFDLDLKALWSGGVRGLIVDLDNTLLPWNGYDIPDQLVQWVALVHQHGFRVLILSNNHDKRVAPIAQKLGVFHIAPARKPWPQAFRRAAKRLSLQPQQCAAIGDQMMTDIVGGKWAGFHTVLVSPLDTSIEHRGTAIFRMMERPILKRLYPNGQPNQLKNATNEDEA